MRYLTPMVVVLQPVDMQSELFCLHFEPSDDRSDLFDKEVFRVHGRPTGLKGPRNKATMKSADEFQPNQ